MGQVSTVLYKINFKYIIKNCTKRELWEKEWVIYDYDKAKIIMRLEAINIRGKSITIRVSGPSFYDYNSFSIPMSKDHFNEKVFYQSAFSAIKSVIDHNERILIEKSVLYETARDMEYEHDLKNEEIANAHLDTLGITDEKVRNAYIDKYVDDNSIQLRGDVRERLRYTINTARYLMLGYQFETLCEEKAKVLIKEVGSKFENQEVEEYVEQISEALDKFDFKEMTTLSESLEKLKEEHHDTNHH